MRTIKFSVLLIISLFITTFTSCEKEETNNNNQNPTPTGNYNFEVGAAKTASFFGTIIDEGKNPLSGVAVSIGSSSAVTDANGVFFIENASVNKNHAFVKAEKSGFFLGSRSVVPTDGVNNIKIMMLQKQSIGSFDANAGGTVSGNGITIDFQAGVVDASGNTYAGTVQVAAKYIDPESNDFADYMPGNLIGADANGGNYLESYGMVAIELTDGSGNELQPADGKDAEVSFPLSAALLNDAPATINLWHFDEARGFWEREGEAVLEGNVYKANVSHFSFWNCDIPTSYVVIDGRVIDENGLPYNDVIVKTVSTNWGSRNDFTDNLGQYGGIVPANEPLVLEFYMDCGGTNTLVHSENIGSISSNTTIADIIINSASSNITRVTGNIVNCSSMPVTNGYIDFDNGDIAYVVGGVFNLVVCDGSTINVKAYDLDALNESGVFTYTVSGANYNIGTVMACTGITEYISWNVNGEELIATGGLSANGQGSYIEIYGNNPNYFTFMTQSYTGPGIYTIDNTFNHSLYGDSLATISSGSIDLNLTDFGLTSGDLIDGSFSGTISGYSPVDSSLVTQTVSGIIHFYKD